MTSKEFVLWLQGFTQGVHEYNISPKQWDALKDVLAKVNDEPTLTIPINSPNTHPFPKWQEPHLLNVPNLNPNNPYTINCNTGSFGTTSTPSFVTTTPGQSSITYATPQFVTSTAYGYPSGSSINYTYNPPYTTGGEDEIIKSHNED
jgi:hypothetical protein